MSAALIKAARDKQSRILRDRERVGSRLAALRVELHRLEASDAHLVAQAKLIERLLAEIGNGAGASSLVVSGSRLRELAVRLLAEKVGVNQDIHYRDWCRLFLAEGFVILGRRPHATFLTAVTRSPLVRGGQEPGVYYVDPGAVDTLRGQLAETDAELRGVLALPDRERLRKRRTHLMASIRRLRRQVAEAERVLA